jgi:ergot alkaloid biosynthesis protein
VSGLVLVTGGTGKTGARLSARLRQAGWSALSASRSSQASGEIRSAAFDWYDPRGHDAALEGVERIYLVAPVGASDPIEVMGPFIERAIAKGACRFVLLSSSLIEEGGPAMGAVHALLRRGAPGWAVLRPSWFMENFSVGQHAATIRDEDAIYSATDDGLVPFIAVEDIVEVAFHALTDDEAVNEGLVITGPKALSYDQAAAIIGAARGRPVRHIRLNGEQLTDRFRAIGLPDEYAAMLAGLDRAIAAGAEARTTATVARMTGQEPQSLAVFAARSAGVWRTNVALDR